MKKRFSILLSGIALLFFFSYQQTNVQAKITENNKVVENSASRDQEEEPDWRVDSIRSEQILKEALKIVTQHKDKNNFIKEYKVDFGNEYHVLVEIDLNFHFTKSIPHLIIRRYTPWSTYIDIYSKNNGIFEKVLSHEQWSLTYTDDTIRDINGDGLNDFVVNWYGASGCCLKGFSDVYLIREDRKTFSDGFEFINPTFSPEEKVIRGICYGHMGETEIYKYRWNGEKVDTLEYVYFEKRLKEDGEEEKTGAIIISANYPYHPNHKILKRLDDIPAEYKEINDYWWFAGEWPRN